MSLDRVSEISAGLPQAERELSDNHAVSKVRGRTFAYYLDDHRGDGIVFKTPDAEALRAAFAVAPKRLATLLDP